MSSGGILAPSASRQGPDNCWWFHDFDDDQAIPFDDFFPAGSGLSFYGRSIFGGSEYWAFSERLGEEATASDRVMFLDTDGGLGVGGSIVDTLGADHWILRLDDAALICCDDDDNELVVDVRRVADGESTRKDGSPISPATATTAGWSATPHAPAGPDRITSRA